jgi:hypothetical protein
MDLEEPYGQHEPGDTREPGDQLEGPVLGHPTESGPYSPAMHLPPSRVAPQISVTGTRRNVRDHVNLAQRGLVERDEISILESFRLLSPAQEIERADVVSLKKLLKPWMPDVADAVDIDEQTWKVEFSIILDHVRFASQYPIPMLQCLKSIIDIAHVPVQIFHTAVIADPQRASFGICVGALMEEKITKLMIPLIRPEGWRSPITADIEPTPLEIQR